MNNTLINNWEVILKFYREFGHIEPLSEFQPKM